MYRFGRNFTIFLPNQAKNPIKKGVIIAVFLFILSAVCWAGGNKEKDVKPTPQVQQQQVQPTQSSTSKYWTGDGGKGISLAILAPKATGLAENQNYLHGTLTKVTIGENVAIALREVGPDLRTIDGFSSFYHRNKKKAGIYTYERGRWRYSPR